MSRIITKLVGLFHNNRKEETKTTQQIFSDIDDITKVLLYKNEATLQKYFSK